jgi:ubiquinone/menaquinone biosynthesis C-methylase UbiE
MKITPFLLLFFFFAGCENTEINQKAVQENKDLPSDPFVLPPLPNEMTFCGQKINLQDEDIIERLDKELLVNAYYHSATIQAMKRASRYFPEMERILKKNGIPEDFKYLAVIESGLIQAVSPAGAQGFWQFMPGTAKEHDLLMNAEVDERLNIEKSTQAACEYLKYANDTLKDWVLAAASYNRGIGGVRSDMRWQYTTNYFDTHMNSETGRYVYRILAVKLIFENPEKYGYLVKETELYKPFETKNVILTESISNLAEWSIAQGFNYKIVRKLNPWILGNKLTIENKEFTLLLPKDHVNLKPYASYQK